MVENIYFHDEIDPSEIPGLYDQCTVGLLSLSADHKTHNIPGKFISYMQNGLPCFAVVNKGNDLSKIIKENQVGAVVENRDMSLVYESFIKLFEIANKDIEISTRCLNLFENRYAASSAAEKIIFSLR